MLGKTISIYGDGENVRDWIYVDDHAKALIQVLEKGIIGRSYNIGSGNELSNIDLANRVCNLLDILEPSKKGPYSNLIRFVADRPGHDFRYAIDPTRIQSELGWAPVVKMEEGLRETVKWYLANKFYWKPSPTGKSANEQVRQP